MSKDNELVVQHIAEERGQGHSTRKFLYQQIQKELGLPIVSFFTSFRYPVMIEDNDADLLEGILQKCCLDKGFALLISSPGGDGLSAERIINICRTRSGTGEYCTIVPGKAKSAATMICLGSTKIFMTGSSELGAIDPQVFIQDEKENQKIFSVYNIIQSYRDLFKRAVDTKGNLQPYLQQLSNYDEREIAEFESVLKLSEDIAIKALKTGMLPRLSPSAIRKKIDSFTTPKEVKVHGRPIYAKEGQQIGLNIEIINPDSKLQELVYELYTRLNSFVSHDNVTKCIECDEYSFRALLPNS
jgi:ATP-dependent protease ClpP protease subunit